MSSNLRAILQARTIAPIVQRLIDGIPVKRGDIIEHARIEAVSGEKRDGPKSRYRSAVARWKRRVLTETGIYLVAVPRVGLRAVTPEEQLRVPVNSMRRANRMIMRGLLAADAVPDAELDAGGVVRKAMVIERGAAALKESRDAVSNIAARLLEPPKGAVKMTQ